MPEQETEPELKPRTIIGAAKLLREHCLEIESRVRLLKVHPFFAVAQGQDGQHDEVKTNIMLAVRHLEDARMRLGKVCQHADDGVSFYDQPPLTGTKGTLDPSDLKMEAVIGATGQASVAASPPPDSHPDA